MADDVTSGPAVSALLEVYLGTYPTEAARQLSLLEDDQALEGLQAVRPELAARAFQRLDPDQAVRLMVAMPAEIFARLFDQIDPPDGVQLMSRLDSALILERLELIRTTLADEYRELLSYPPDSAGALMDPRVASYYGEESVHEVLQRLRAQRERRVVSVCVVDAQRKLKSVVSLQDVAVADPDQALGSINARPPITVTALTPREDLVAVLEERRLASLPVVDAQGRLLGIIRYDTLLSAARQEASDDVVAMFGASRDERALSPAMVAVRKRLPWLEINLGTAFLAAFVVGLFEDIISQITALAIFLPVVAGQSGNTGSQALAVTMRGLALREVRVRQWPLIVRKELAAAFVNGLVVAVTTAGIAYLWMRSAGLSLIIGVSMVASMVIAGMSGALVPVVLKSLGQDPAQSSSIILTTVTDVIGFLTFLGLAALLATRLGLV